MLYQKIFLFGLDASGKTAISQAMRTGKADENQFPTTAFDIKALFLKYFEESIEFRVWDAPGQTDYRSLWGEGYKSASLMLFVLDTAAKNRYPEAKQVLEKVLQDPETRTVPIIFLFHKMDMDDAKKNFPDAFNYFRTAMRAGDRTAYRLRTSIKQPETIENIKMTIAEIVEKSRA
ncbi:MAG: ADP-ribosylation factor-like protein [Candidatus Sigynarchaeota archaeon]